MWGKMPAKKFKRAGTRYTTQHPHTGKSTSCTRYIIQAARGSQWEERTLKTHAFTMITMISRYRRRYDDENGFLTALRINKSRIKQL